MTGFDQPLRQALQGQHPIIYVQSPEEDRVVDALATLATDELGPGAQVWRWTCTDGLEGSPDPLATRDPAAAIHQIIAAPGDGVYVLKDLTSFMQEPAVQRALRDAYYALRERPATAIVVVSPLVSIPTLVEKEVCLVELPLPTAAELHACLDAYQQANGSFGLPDDLANEISLSLRGLTLSEVTHILHRVRKSGDLSADGLRDQVFLAKEMLLRKAGYLEYVPIHRDLASIGGMDALKEWIHKRQGLFNQEAVDKGLPIPKGVLFMGVSGCGKSLASKTIAAIWRIPLFRLDMNIVFSGLYGTPEATFHHALKTIESVAPAIIWIDEIENGLNVSVNGGTNDNQIFSAFLTWMQEKPPMIFVVATANHIQQLPAEIIRKGRFDQVFFCDLPNETEREEIIRIHVKRQGGDAEQLDIGYLVIATDGWNGAEIEQAVISARIDAYQDNRTFTTRDITRHTRNTVPLSETMSEQIKGIRDWAWGRATSASKPKPKI